jgi:hypothetical protein
MSKDGLSTRWLARVSYCKVSVLLDLSAEEARECQKESQVEKVGWNRVSCFQSSKSTHLRNVLFSV